jgi:CBS domain containing-hemolysin-like protein
MPDPDPPSRGTEPARNLPVPVVPPGAARQGHESWFGSLMRTLFGWKTGSIRADLENVLVAGTPTETGFSPAESALLKNILGLRERRIDDVMVPRADIVAVQQDISLGELLKVFESAAHSRLVVFGETLDDPVGMIHIRDLIGSLMKRAALPKPKTRRKKSPGGLDFSNVDLAIPLSELKLVRALLFVPPSMPAIDLLAKMQATRIHLALVIDEYGGTDGLVSMEDIVEQVVGDIEDEHDEASIHTVVRQHDGSFLADGRASLDDVIAAIGPDFDVGEAGKEVDTIGGYLVTRIGRVPARGENVPGPGEYEFEVLDADPRRVKKIRIARRKAANPARRRDVGAASAQTSAAAAAPAPKPEPAAPAEPASASGAASGDPPDPPPPQETPAKDGPAS